MIDYGIDIRILEYKKPDLKGGILIDGFPTSSLATALVANYLVSAKSMDQVAFVDSSYFPPVAFVYGSKPRYPARVYVEEGMKLAVFLSEFNIPATLSRPVAKMMIDWAMRNGISTVLSTLSIPAEVNGIKIYGVGSTERARNMLSSAGIEQLSYGVVPGIPGVLLCEGRWSNFDVVVLIAVTNEQTPLFLVAASLLETLNALIPDLKLDVTPLRKRAEEMQEKLKSIRKVAQATELKPMYG